MSRQRKADSTLINYVASSKQLFFGSAIPLGAPQPFETILWITYDFRIELEFRRLVARVSRTRTFNFTIPFTDTATNEPVSSRAKEAENSSWRKLRKADTAWSATSSAPGLRWRAKQRSMPASFILPSGIRPHFRKHGGRYVKPHQVDELVTEVEQLVRQGKLKTQYDQFMYSDADGKPLTEFAELEDAVDGRRCVDCDFICTGSTKEEKVWDHARAAHHRRTKNDRPHSRPVKAQRYFKGVPGGVTSGGAPFSRWFEVAPLPDADTMRNDADREPRGEHDSSNTAKGDQLNRRDSVVDQDDDGGQDLGGEHANRRIHTRSMPQLGAVRRGGVGVSRLSPHISIDIFFFHFLIQH
ncbi:hypothetical protein BDW02DRAFT_595109 [Decorospora gaudefroyi]|uniref:Uncharacterized protein n=1 Tax=Decorospora gaudefroyi TaxID=184978 RepID=A0A6A5KPR7_9PLEO|nr:hypothetical protein BDW02DRAFT_595109 [Decorospora gaudefroyi]